MDNFSAGVEEFSTSKCCSTCDAKTLIKDLTCFKNPEKSTEVTLIVEIPT